MHHDISRNVHGCSPLGALAVVLLTGCGAKPLPTSSSGRAWIDVRTFGARGDGKSDDTTALTLALDQACRDGGRTLYFPSGHYRYSRTLRVTGSRCSNLLIVGDGPSSVLQFQPR